MLLDHILARMSWTVHIRPLIQSDWGFHIFVMYAPRPGTDAVEMYVRAVAEVTHPGYIEISRTGARIAITIPPVATS